MLDPDGCVVSWNTEAERLMGHSKDDVLGEPHSVVSPRTTGLRVSPPTSS